MAICKISVADSARVSQSCNEISAADCPVGASLLAMSYSPPTWVRVYSLGLVLALIAITVGCIVAAGATPNERGVRVAHQTPLIAVVTLSRLAACECVRWGLFGDLESERRTVGRPPQLLCQVGVDAVEFGHRDG